MAYTMLFKTSRRTLKDPSYLLVKTSLIGSRGPIEYV